MSFLRSRSIRSEATDSLSLASERYFTAGEAIPVAIPLEKADFGGATFQSGDHNMLEDLQLLYEMDTGELSVQAAILGSRNSKQGTYRIRGVEAANLELVNPLTGYLESILVRVVIETNQNVTYEPFIGEEGSCVVEDIHTRRVVLHAPVHECGHLRDILLFMKSNTSLCSLSISKDNPYFNPKGKEYKPGSDNKPPLTYLSPLPWWSVYVPWRLYSSNIRRLLQLSLLTYSIFTIVWASWQLYRHVNVIQVALEPVVQLLKVYLDDIMIAIDGFLAWFTELSTRFLRPIHIFSGMFLVPLIQMLLAFKSALIPILTPVLNFTGQLSRLFTPFFAGIWQSIVSSRVALQNIDLRQQVAKNLVINSFKAIFQGLLRLVGYSRTKSKEKKVIKARTVDKSLPAGTPVKRKYTGPNASIPVYYLSPPAPILKNTTTNN